MRLWRFRQRALEATRHCFEVADWLPRKEQRYDRRSIAGTVRQISISPGGK
jgi:hypothetical protein